MNGEPPQASDSCPHPSSRLAFWLQWRCLIGVRVALDHAALHLGPSDVILTSHSLCVTRSSVLAGICAPYSPCLLLYCQSDTTEQFNQTLTGEFMDHSITGTWLDSRPDRGREEMGWGWALSWHETAARQAREDEGILLTQTIWKGRVCCGVVVYQVIALQIECQHN